MTRGHNNTAIREERHWRSGKAVEKAVREERERIFNLLKKKLEVTYHGKISPKNDELSILRRDLDLIFGVTKGEKDGK